MVIPGDGAAAIASGNVLPARLEGRLRALARAIVHDEEEADDIVQETIVRVLANMGQFAHRASYSTWVTRIMMHEAFARVRRRRRIQQLDESGPSKHLLATPAFSTHDRNPEERLIDREFDALLLTALRILPDDHRSTFILRALEGLNTEEVAARLNISFTCARTRLYRARQLLRERLGARLGLAPGRSHASPSVERTRRSTALNVQTVGR